MAKKKASWKVYIPEASAKREDSNRTCVNCAQRMNACLAFINGKGVRPGVCKSA